MTPFDRRSSRLTVFLCALLLWVIAYGYAFAGSLVGAIVHGVFAVLYSWVWAAYPKYAGRSTRRSV